MVAPLLKQKASEAFITLLERLCRKSPQDEQAGTFCDPCYCHVRSENARHSTQDKISYHTLGKGLALSTMCCYCKRRQQRQLRALHGELRRLPFCV